MPASERAIGRNENEGVFIGLDQRDWRLAECRRSQAVALDKYPIDGGTGEYTYQMSNASGGENAALVQSIHIISTSFLFAVSCDAGTKSQS